MNFCRRCESDYEKPGTCNCFAERPAHLAPTIVPQPIVVPPYPIQPMPYVPTPTTPIITIGDPMPGQYPFTITVAPPITSGTVTCLPVTAYNAPYVT